MMYLYSLVQDVCLLFPGLNCSYGCKQDPNNQTVGHCFCPEGFILSELDMSSCIGINPLSTKYDI